MEQKIENNNENTQIDIESQPPYAKYPALKDWIFRLVLFAIGLLGLELITLIIQVVIMIANPALLDEKSDLYITGLTMINAIRYIILAFGFVALLFPRLKIIAPKFINWKTDLIGVLGGGILIGLTILYNLTVSQFVDVGVNNNEIMAETMIKTFPVLSIFVLGIIGPICEEITYRYGLFACIKKKNMILAYIATTIIFALIHFDFTGNMTVELLNLPTYLMAGAGLCFIYHKFGFNASIIAHVVNNMYAIIVTLIGK